jgi:DNA-binding CsgD family transcriptional regulator
MDRGSAVMNLPVATFDQDLRAANSIAACNELFLRVLRPFDVDTLAAGEIDLRDKGLVVFFALAWPEAWTRFYVGRRLHEHDPVLACLEHYGGPFTWGDMRRDRRFSGLTQDTFDRARDHGWTDGLVVPIPRGAGRYGLVSLAARRDDFSPEAKGVISLMAIAFHQHVRALALMEGFPRPPAGLTDRERECLQLIARGLSDKAIAQDLGIAEVTARSYFEGARRKLKAHTRPETVAKAASWGIISGG